MLSKEKMMKEAIQLALKEDIGDGDHSALACIPSSSVSRARLIVKENGVLAGVDAAKIVFNQFVGFEIKTFISDGEKVKVGDVVLEVSGNARDILSCERLVLNIIQRMSGIATYTSFLMDKIQGTKARLLDTRKTTPNFRVFEKEAVKIGGGNNHRFALYDMIMLKDNHMDFAGGIESAIKKTNDYLSSTGKKLKIEVEVRDFDELDKALNVGGFDRIMLDNFTPRETVEALKKINGKYETESSGGITENTIKAYAETGVDFISVGALTHHVKSLDMSLKAF
ncbi:MAG: nicotinate-nucleotide diphosphorylase (carboxylating) [Flavobacteriales bacterium]|nr:nicotinate-nucleotide diphosphorylase (carboxylating) [Flavobacteriales bacterium]MBO72272.1 nicotinate-nucleotide diphosphorylase (carboxylating) [Flavobacteriales bacterium]|tara:strand:- start:1154 stop:1999 length:846 start_codon:yes stop_codon:yes gene_type:complete